MLDIGYDELLLIAVVALVVIGPKDLPRVLRHVGQWINKARGMARHVRSGFDTMVREAELDEMQKQWAAQNDAIMAVHPATGDPYDPPLAGEVAARSDDGGVSPYGDAAQTTPPGDEQSTAPPATPLRHRPAADATSPQGGGSA